MKFNITKLNIAILAVIFAVIMCTGGMLGFQVFRSEAAISFDPSASYVLNGVDLTSEILYSTVTNAYLTSFIFTMLGVFSGCIINTAILILFVLIKFITSNSAYFKRKRKVKKEWEKWNEELKEKKEALYKAEKEARKKKTKNKINS